MSKPLDVFRVARDPRGGGRSAEPADRRPRLRAHRARADDGRARRGPRRDRLHHGRARDRQDPARLGGARPLSRPRALHRGAAASPTPRPSPTGPSASCCASGSASAPRRRRPASGSSSRPSWRTSSGARRRTTPIRSSPTSSASTLEPEASQAIRELNRESIQSRTFEVFFELVCKLADEEPLCLVFEDLHWADEATLELLESILGMTDETSVALFFVYRAEREHGSWRLGELARQRYPHRYREIEVRPLPADSSRVLVSNAADGELPESVAELLAERSGGNPFFLEEAFRDLVERGVLERRNGGWELAVSEDELSIPAVVQGTLQARLDRLDRQTRDVLSIAAVIGRTFGLPLLERLVDRDQLMQALTDLQRLDLIVEKRRRPNPEYRFRHGLVQEVAYASLVDTQRRKLHKRVGEALEEIYKESPEEAYGLLARHFEEADEPEKAVDYLLKAGDAARAVYADKEALEHYRRARAFLARVGDERRARDTLFKMALAYHLAFDFESAEEMYDEAFSCRVGEDPRLPATERLETASNRPNELAPGDVYTTEAGYFSELLFRGLLMVDSELNVVPAMADNFRVSSDGLTYLFRIREGAKWSDGEPLTADDYAFAWSQMRELKTRTAFLMEDVEAAEALDDRTLEVRLREPRSYFPYILCSPWAFPWPRHRCEALGDDWAKPENLVGNGPYMLVEFDDDHALLRANPHWSGAARERRRDPLLVLSQGRADGRGLAGGEVRPPARLRPGLRGGAGHDGRHRPGARSPVHRVLRRQLAVLERARPQGVLARGRPRGAAGHLPDALARGEPRGRDPAGDARPLPPGRRRVRPRPGPRAARGGRLSRRQGPTRDPPRRPALAPAGRRDRRAVEADRRAHQGHAGSRARRLRRDRRRRHVVERLDGRLPGSRRLLPRPPHARLAVLLRRRHPRAPRQRPLAARPGRAHARLPRGRPPLGGRARGASSPSATRAPSSCAAPGSRACGRARSPGRISTQSWSGSAASPRATANQPSGNSRRVLRRSER